MAAEIECLYCGNNQLELSTKDALCPRCGSVYEIQPQQVQVRLDMGDFLVALIPTFAAGLVVPVAIEILSGLTGIRLTREQKKPARMIGAGIGLITYPATLLAIAISKGRVQVA